MGNICRSPTAEGTMRALVAEAGLGDEVELDSAGTGGWHVGERPDRRARAAAKARGITLEKVRLLREFDPADHGELDVPDPYYGGDDGFEEVLDLVRAACEGLLEQIREGEIA
jgi:protein-tyrosine phosphatase